MKELLEELVAYVFASERDFVIEKIANYETFDEWSNFVLNETIYGSALKVQFRDASHGEMIRDLAEIWEEH